MNEIMRQIGSMEPAQILKAETLYSLMSKPSEERDEFKLACLIRLGEFENAKENKGRFLEMLNRLEDFGSELGEPGIILECDAKGKPIATIENFLKILREDAEFKDLKFNEMSNAPEHEVMGKTERWSDDDDAAARLYIEKYYKIRNRELLSDALRILFSERRYHPIKRWIEFNKWDGVSRIETLFIKWLKCEDTPYSREVCRLVFAGGIHRLYNPGCKFDDVPVLVGTNQGEGKSTFVRWLAMFDKYFSEVCDIEGQKGSEALEGAWICEIAELLAVTKVKDVEAVKAYITKQSDRYRRPYEKRVSEVKRQCIFIGTTNKLQFLTDKTGNRRWYPLQVHSVGHELFEHKGEIMADIVQAWAEAKALYDKGELKPYANINLRDTIAKMQQAAVEEDWRSGAIESYLEGKDKVCIAELWKYALDNSFTKPSRKDSNEISLILQGLGEWERGANERSDEFGYQVYWNRKKKDFFRTVEADEIPFEY